MTHDWTRKPHSYVPYVLFKVTLRCMMQFLLLIIDLAVARRQTTRNRTETCARPDCPHVAEAEDGLYFVERLVGRESVGQAGYRWLAKWDG
ncbi:hypothetical protein M404DRAFT_992312 [Pisolithus tinctorius Marx 270]|nr:hypothetical protein M404DRAFT_992312 [Pisolithus tinctorius Marx 270]